MLSSTALPLLLLAAVAAALVGVVGGGRPQLDDDYFHYEDEYDDPAASTSEPPPPPPTMTTSAPTSASTEAETSPPPTQTPSTPDPTTTTPEIVVSSSTFSATVLPDTATTNWDNSSGGSSTTEGQDERQLHSLRGGGGGGGGGGESHEGTKRAGSTQAKGAATITKAMHAKSSSTKGKDRGASRNAFRQTTDSDEATNSIWNNPTTPIDPDEEDLHFEKVIAPFEMPTRGPYVAPTESAPTKTSGRYQLTQELALKLQKLDFYFMQLAVLAEDCRRRLLCEVADQQADFQPLAFVLMEESSFRGNYESVRPALMSTTDGARLLTYMEATASGQDRARGCSGFVYRCPTKAQEMVDMDALGLWRDMVRWMSVQVVSRRPAAAT